MEKRRVTMQGDALTAVGMPLAVGAKAPDFKLTATDLSQKTLADFGDQK